jgi:hypothetical protein
MKNQLRRLLVTIGLSAVLGSSLLNAQTSGKIAVANVPFSFRIADRVLPSGNYTVTAHSNGLTELRNADNQQAMMFLTGSNLSSKKSDSAKLVFNCYGDRYFLSQIWLGNSDAGRVLPKGRLENEIAGTGKTPGSLASIRIN